MKNATVSVSCATKNATNPIITRNVVEFTIDVDEDGSGSQFALW
jgi:hypothetical protein